MRHNKKENSLERPETSGIEPSIDYRKAAFQARTRMLRNSRGNRLGIIFNGIFTSAQFLNSDDFVQPVRQVLSPPVSSE